MKLKFFAAAFAFAFAAVVLSDSAAFGQQQGYVFTDVKINDVSEVKDQASSGTCWCFASTAMLESQSMKQGKGEVDLSEMWIVRNAYFDKVKNYIRMHGNTNLGAGGTGMDVPVMAAKYGLVPEEVYPGIKYGSERHNHGELDNTIKAFADGILKSKKPTIAWENALNGILDAYFGERPETFTYKGRQYTPQSYAQSLGISGDDFIQITSFTHHPFYKSFVLEIPDNWTWASAYNVPMEDFETIIDAVLEQGHTVSWAADISERGYQHNKGFAVVPTGNVEDLSTTEKARWTEFTAEEMGRMVTRMDGPMPEKNITQANRQEAFDNYETTDDHSMLIVGVAKDQNGRKYYKVKNSWGKGNVYGGYFYVSVPFVQYKTTALTVNRNAIPAEVVRKIRLQ